MTIDYQTLFITSPCVLSTNIDHDIHVNIIRFFHACYALEQKEKEDGWGRTLMINRIYKNSFSLREKRMNNRVISVSDANTFFEKNLAELTKQEPSEVNIFQSNSITVDIQEKQFRSIQ